MVKILIMCKYIVKKILLITHCIVPKNKKKIFFASFPFYSDNARALFEYIVNCEQYSDYTLYWLMPSGVESTTNLNSRARLVSYNGVFKRGYLKYLYHVYTAYYLFCTHNHFVEANPSRQVSVCLWHGTPLKNIGYLNKNENSSAKSQFSYFLSPTINYNKLLTKAFKTTEDRMLNIGYPRNDLLFRENDSLKILDLDDIEHQKIVVYMPTFRVPIGGAYSDTSTDLINLIDLSNIRDTESLNLFLRERKIVLVIKYHPSDSLQLKNIRLSNIRIVSNNLIEEKKLQFYDLLHYAEALITDYSSVFCDYMLLSKPIAFIVNDMDDYSSNRGFVFSKPLDYLPGYIVTNKSQLIDFFEDVAINIDLSQNKRAMLFDTFNMYNDGNSCKRLLNYLNV